MEGFKKTWKCKLRLHFFAGLNKANKSHPWRRSSLCFATSTLPKSEKELSSSHIEWLKRWWRRRKRRRGVLKVMRHAKELLDKGWLTNYTLQRAGVEERGLWRALLGRASIAIANANARASASAFARGHALFQAHSKPRNDQHFAPQ